MSMLGGKLKFLRSKLRRVKIKNWMLILALVPLLFLDATLLRLNHIRMTELRDDVLMADAAIGEAGTEAEAEAAETKLAEKLTKLKEFVFHDVVINVVEENGEQKVTFGTGVFYLERQYLRAANRALNEAEKKLTSDNNPNGNIYGMAGETCGALAVENGWDWDSAGYINCMMSEIAKYPAAGEIQDTIIAELPSTELYRRNYASPIWAPTITGFLILITLIIIVVIIVRIIIWVVLRIALIFV